MFCLVLFFCFSVKFLVLGLSSRRLVESVSSGGKTYESFLRQVLEFHNPSNVSNLTSMFDIKENSTQPSLMRGLFRFALYLLVNLDHVVVSIDS